MIIDQIDSYWRPRRRFERSYYQDSTWSRRKGSLWCCRSRRGVRIACGQPAPSTRAPRQGSKNGIGAALTIYPQIPRHSWTNSRSSFRRIFFSRMRNLERATIIFTTGTLDYLIWRSLIADLPNEINPTFSYTSAMNLANVRLSISSLPTILNFWHFSPVLSGSNFDKS